MSISKEAYGFTKRQHFGLRAWRRAPAAPRPRAGYGNLYFEIFHLRLIGRFHIVTGVVARASLERPRRRSRAACRAGGPGSVA